MSEGLFWLGHERCAVAEGELRLLSAREVLEARRESEELWTEGREKALCANACLVARALERDGRPVFADGAAVLDSLRVEDIVRLSDRWARLNRESNPSPCQSEEELQALKESLSRRGYERLQWRVLRSFGVLPTEERARSMKDRDYLWCALHLALDREEELDSLCPQCRERAEREPCPVCGEERSGWGVNPAFDLSRFEKLKGGGL